MKRRRLRWDNWRRDVFMVFLGAVLTFTAGSARQWATANAQQATLRALIRVELAQNSVSLSRSSRNLRRAASGLERFLSGDAPAPPLAAGYLGLATVGLQNQLGIPSVFHADHRLLALYSLVYGRVLRLMEVQRTLDAAAVQYSAALSPEDRRHAAAQLKAVIGYQLRISDALTSEHGGLLTLVQCMDQFEAGEDECEYVPGALDATDVMGNDTPQE